MYKALRGGRIRSRRGVVAVIVILQALVLAAGWLFTFAQVRRATAHAVQQLVLSENARVAEWFAEQLAGEGTGTLAEGSDLWERVQRRVETLELSADGFVCLLDDQGRVVCHPEIRRIPGLRGATLASERLLPGDGGAALRIGEAPLAETITGEITLGLAETHFVATRWVPELGARLVVHQPESGLVRLSSHATVVVGAVAGGAALSVLALTALVTLGVMHRYDSSLERINTELEAEVSRRTGQALAARDALILGLADLADRRDADTGRHLERIGAFSVLLARQLAQRWELDQGWIERLRIASSLHDVGKVAVPDAILLKPGPLTGDERAIMQRHAAIGAESLESIRGSLGDDALLEMCIRIAREHHERWDAAGYPAGLGGKEISPEARIVALADVYDALTSRRPYKDAMPHKHARELITQERGRHFDPAVVDAFLAVEHDFARVARDTAADTRATSTLLAA